MVQRHGEAVPGLAAFGLTHTFPPAERLAAGDLGGLGLTQARMRAIGAFAAAVAAGEVRLDHSLGLDQLEASITALPGLGPWTAQYIAMRMGERDAFPAGDLGLQRSLANRTPTPSKSLPELAERWRPWRATAAVHLWAADPVGSRQPACYQGSCDR